MGPPLRQRLRSSRLSLSWSHCGGRPRRRSPPRWPTKEDNSKGRGAPSGERHPRAATIPLVVSVADGVRRYLQFLVVERGLADNTVESYERDLRRYARFL